MASSRSPRLTATGCLAGGPCGREGRAGGKSCGRVAKSHAAPSVLKLCLVFMPANTAPAALRICVTSLRLGDCGSSPPGESQGDTSPSETAEESLVPDASLRMDQSCPNGSLWPRGLPPPDGSSRRQRTVAACSKPYITRTHVLASPDQPDIVRVGPQARPAPAVRAWLTG